VPLEYEVDDVTRLRGPSRQRNAQLGPNHVDPVFEGDNIDEFGSPPSAEARNLVEFVLTCRRSLIDRSIMGRTSNRRRWFQSANDIFLRRSSVQPINRRLNDVILLRSGRPRTAPSSDDRHGDQRRCGRWSAARSCRSGRGLRPRPAVQQRDLRIVQLDLDKVKDGMR
jgi:hypothetical protein